MPVGPYETFKECERAQRRKGKGKESAKRICGHIEKKTKQGKKK